MADATSVLHVSPVIPVVTIVGLQFALLLSGAVLTEATFTWPGLGLSLYQFLQNRDYTAAKHSEVIDNAQRLHLTIYTIGVEDNALSSSQPADLNKGYGMNGMGDQSREVTVLLRHAGGVRPGISEDHKHAACGTLVGHHHAPYRVEEAEALALLLFNI